MDPLQIVIVFAALLLGGVVGLLVGRSSGRIAALEEGRESGLEEASESARAQGYEEGVDAARRGEREVALREAIGRVSSFLHSQVRAPLAGATEESDEGELRERIQRALGSLEDLDFFIQEAGTTREGADLTKLAQSVSREFAADHDVGVRLLMGQ
ncbi:MAG: hypothetical protein R3253_08320, partial [Longimicrobiales bacterium]|nr:hypothetical protein [Longimicrobiales bacterium]